MAVAGVGAYPVDGDEERAFYAKRRGQVGVFDHLSRNVRVSAWHGIGQRPRPADGIVDQLAVEVTKEPMPTWSHQPAAGQFLEPLRMCCG